MRFGLIVAETHAGESEFVATRKVPLHEQQEKFRQLRIARATKPTHPKWAKVVFVDADSEAAVVQELAFQPEPKAVKPEKK